MEKTITYLNYVLDLVTVAMVQSLATSAFIPRIGELGQMPCTQLYFVIANKVPAPVFDSLVPIH